MPRSFSIALLAALVLGCGGDSPPRVQLAASPDVVHLPSYAPGTWGEIPYTITNRSDRSVLYGACSLTVEHGVGGRWESPPPPGMCIAIGIRLGAGATTTGQVPVPGAGTYRLRLDYSDDSGLSKSWSAVSNVVTVE